MITAGRTVDAVRNHASPQSLRGLDWLSFFLAGVLTGFGPFVALYLAGSGWTQVEIGFVLTVSGLTGLLIQVPAGEMLDMTRSKRPLVALGVATIAGAALILACRPTFTPVLIAQTLLGITGGFVGPAVAAISLGLVGNDRLPERLGRNQRFAAIGGLGTAGVMGLLGYLLSNQVIFFASAALAVPTLVALGRIRAGDIHFARACAAPISDYHLVKPPRTARIAIGANDRLLIFASCIILFQLANASVLPLVSEQLGRDHRSPLVLSALIFVPQIVVAILAPWIGRSAGTWGRRPQRQACRFQRGIRRLARATDPVRDGALRLRAGCRRARTERGRHRTRHSRPHGFQAAYSGATGADGRSHFPARTDRACARICSERET
jgi:MFS family permease